MGTAQTPKSKNVDSTKVMFQKLEKYSKKGKFRTFLHKLIFTSTTKRKQTGNDFRKKVDQDISKNKGKIIRKINIESLDPFGFSAENEAKEPKNSFENFGNDVHIKTKKWTIRNNLLFKKNQPLDSLLVKESERLIRRQRFVRSVVIKAVPIENNSDSVDVSIRVLDSWSLIPNGSISGSRMNIDITERNFFGLGHEFSNDFGKRFNDKQNSYSGKYSINNIKNTFINAAVEYQKTFQNDVTKKVAIERPFFSPLTKFAGGISFETKKINDSLPNSTAIFEKIIFENETQDFWFGYAFKLLKNTSKDYRNTNFVTTIGYKNLDFLKEVNASLDPNKFLTDEKLYLMSFGITTRKFMQEKYIFNFDIIEDIPYGKVYSITTGMRNKNAKNNLYVGGRYSHGQFYNFGYLSANVEVGTFFNGSNSLETTLKIEANYFTNLLSLGNWRIRQFIKPSLVMGINRDPSFKDRTTLDGNNGFDGFTNPLFNGTRKLSIIFQTQTYVPGAWKGFHFSPFITSAFGYLGDSQNTFLNSKLYSKFTAGVLINNDYLVFNRFQLSFSFYPTIPFEGTNILRTNTVENNDFSIPDYSIGQPTIVNFK
jgi:hypothetical protein